MHDLSAKCSFSFALDESKKKKDWTTKYCLSDSIEIEICETLENSEILIFWTVQGIVIDSRQPNVSGSRLVDSDFVLNKMITKGSCSRWIRNLNITGNEYRHFVIKILNPSRVWWSEVKMKFDPITKCQMSQPIEIAMSATFENTDPSAKSTFWDLWLKRDEQ
jgi:hypothetical protein